jgi:hypothetical protein
MPKKYRKKPVVIEAVQWTGNNDDDIMEFVSTGRFGDDDDDGVYIMTLEGEMRASVGDYIIKGVQGEFYPCKPDIFEQTYEPA